jgi:hypothetical protein
MSNVQPVGKMTLGQHLDAVLTAAGHDVTLAKNDVVSWSEGAWAWIKTNIVHIAGYASIVAAVKKFI